MAVVCPYDVETLGALGAAVREGIARFVLVGEGDRVVQTAEDAGLDIDELGRLVAVPDPQAVEVAVTLAREGQVGALMKGMVSTAAFLRGVLDRSRGLRREGLLSHVALLDIPSYSKLLAVTDGGINELPGVAEKEWILRNYQVVARALGVREPRVALLASSESEGRIKANAEAVVLRERARVAFPDMRVEGPIALDVAVSARAARVKGVEGHVPGEADCLLVPNIETGNALCKGLVYFAGAIFAGVVVGARVPLVLLSRADLERSKLASIALGTVLVTAEG